MALQYFQLPSCQYSFREPNSSRNRPHFLTSKCRTSTPIRCVGSIQVSERTKRHSEFSYQPTAWSHDSIESLKIDFSKNIHKEKVKTLEEEVRALVEDASDSPSTLELLELIDDIERLGLGYLFHKNIRAALDQFVLADGKIVGEEESLHAISLRFRLLRQHGYDVSQEFLKRFNDSTGGFVECLKEDVKGLLSLYEASFLAFEGEQDLHSAKLFATEHLKKLKDYQNEVLKQNIDDALDLPLYRRMPRLQARCYIDSYGKRKDANRHLLELAALDFNKVQSIHQTDLQHASRWWRRTGLATKLSFIRDRLMECFFWGMGLAFEPQYSTCRIGLTKVCAFITTIDDIYDVYGSLEELEQFTYAVKRWDTKSLEHMPEYLKLSFLALYNTINDLCYDTLIEQGQNIIPVLQKVWEEICQAFLVEAKWTHNQQTPTLEDYLDNGWRSVSGVVILSHSCFLINQGIMKDALESLEKCHDLLKWSSVIFRLCNDLGTSSDEIKRGKTANAISCYMNESGVPEEVAREHIKTLIDEAWWKLNETRMAYSNEFEDPFIDMTINLARMSHCTYQYGDGHGAPDAIAKHRVMSLLIDPITVRTENNYISKRQAIYV